MVLENGKHPQEVMAKLVHNHKCYVHAYALAKLVHNHKCYVHAYALRILCLSNPFLLNV